jgi:hypothetical protein
MTEALWGVIIGGLIASVTPVFNVLVESRKWQLSQRTTHLRLRRDQFEKLFDEVYQALLDGQAQTGLNMPIEIWAKLDLHLPTSVMNELEKLFEEKDRTPEKMRGHLFSIQLAMKASIAKLDREIERLTNTNILCVTLPELFDATDDKPRGWWNRMVEKRAKEKAAEAKLPNHSPERPGAGEVKS